MLHTNYASHLQVTPNKSWRKLVSYSINDWRVSAYSLIIVSVFLIIISSVASHGDEVTGAPQTDTKEMSYTTSGVGVSYTTAGPAQLNMATGFLPMPAWARGPRCPHCLISLPRWERNRSWLPRSPAPPLPRRWLPRRKRRLRRRLLLLRRKRPPSPRLRPKLRRSSPYLRFCNGSSRTRRRRTRRVSRQVTLPLRRPPVRPMARTPSRRDPPANANSQDPYWLPPLIDSADIRHHRGWGVGGDLFNAPAVTRKTYGASLVDLDWLRLCRCPVDGRYPRSRAHGHGFAPAEPARR